MKIILTALLGLVLPFLAYNQSYTIPSTPVLSYLYKTNNEISSITKSNKLNLFPLKIGYQPAKFNLLKNKNGLFALVDGTGQVYKATSLVENKITFTRIDSTNFFGNNFESIKFSYKGTIYSFGGYGFWNKNGQLSHFTPGAEWSIDKINKKYRTDNGLYEYNPKESKIYYIEFPFKDEATNEKENDPLIIAFDLKSKKNIVLGKLYEKLKLQYNYFNVDLPSINSVLVGGTNEVVLINFSNNKVYKLINSKIKDDLTGMAGAEIQTTFENDGELFYTFETDTTLRSLKVTMSDFKEEPYPLYTEINNELYIGFIIALFIIATFVLLMIFYKQRNRKSKIEELAVTSDKEEIYISDLNSIEFNSIEENLINRLIEKSNIDSYLTVDELNSILGIKKKTIEIQKRVRTEAINRINHKFNVNYNLETAFIERTRSAEDRRFFNYIISKENAKVYLKNRPSN